MGKIILGSMLSEFLKKEPPFRSFSNECVGFFISQLGNSTNCRDEGVVVTAEQSELAQDCAAPACSEFISERAGEALWRS